MIKGLDDVVTAVKADETNLGDFKPLPKGWYDMELIEVKDWKEREIKTLDVIEFDDKFQKVKDASGNDVKETVKNLKIFETVLTFKVLDGKYKGRRIFGEISTFPNTPWVIPNLVHALGKPTLKLGQLKSMVNTKCACYVDIKSYTKTVEDDDGFEDEVTVTINEIKRYKPLEVSLDINEEDLDI